MNVNLSNVAATNKTSVSESGATTSTERSESQGFFETLAGVFADSRKAEATDGKLTTEVPEAPEVSGKESTSSVQSAEPEGDTQKTVAVDEKIVNHSTNTLLDQDGVLTESEEQAMVLETRVTGSSTTTASNSVNAARQAESDLKHTVAMKRKPEQQDAKSDQVVDLDVSRSMDEGQRLLGRIEQANQALNPVNQETEHGKSLPPATTGVLHNVHSMKAKRSGEEEDVESAVGFGSAGERKQADIEPSEHGLELAEGQEKTHLRAQPEAIMEPNTVNVEAMANAVIALSNDKSGGIATNLVQRVTIDVLEVIDTKLAQGKPLTSQEAQIIDGLKTGAVIAELPEEELAQLVAFPNEVKLALSEAQATQHNAKRQQMNVSTPTPQVAAQELKAAAGQVPTQAAEKAVIPAMPEGLTMATVNPAIGQMVANKEVNHKAMNAAFVAGSLKATTDKQDKPEAQHGLASQLQAVAGQQGVITPQQTRADAVQQAQLPLQLTKELANDQVAEKVQMMMSKNLKSLDIRLDPPELGRMQIRMTMNSDLANVHFTVTNPQARDIIEQTLPRLREMLAQQGLQLADSSVQQQSSGQQQSGYAAAEQNRQGSLGRGFSGQSEESLDAGVELNVQVTSSPDGISFYA
ncbi:MAG: flagellar hook-length control protein FliK [Vibrionaceae bacterium]|nr:flagellar hook-length control protein FliK [Vibrionaceae bacterium]